MAYGTIQECPTNKYYYCINVVCIQIVMHWATNRECSINQGNMVYILARVHTLSKLQFCIATTSILDKDIKLIQS